MRYRLLMNVQWVAYAKFWLRCSLTAVQPRLFLRAAICKKSFWCSSSSFRMYASQTATYRNMNICDTAHKKPMERLQTSPQDVWRLCRFKCYLLLTNSPSSTFKRYKIAPMKVWNTKSKRMPPINQQRARVKLRRKMKTLIRSLEWSILHSRSLRLLKLVVRGWFLT